jgi:hypothetical protein
MGHNHIFAIGGNMQKLLLILLVSFSAYGEVHKFIPDDHALELEGLMSVNEGVNKKKFRRAIKWGRDVYAPLFEKRGLKLEIIGDWESTVVNAYAQRIGTTARVMMFGGLARKVNFHGFLMVVCHEIGHHIGGSPKYRGHAWASNEGQSDYFATAKCMKRILKRKLSKKARPLKSEDEDIDYALGKCKEFYPGKKRKRMRTICTRNIKGALSLATLLNRGIKPKFTTPDQTEVAETYDRHPRGQCRLDSYFAGALCKVSFKDDFDESNPNINACTRADGYPEISARPLCWFYPN